MLWSNEGQKEQVFLQSHFYLLQQTLIQYEGRPMRLFGSNLVGRQLAQPPGTLGTGATSGKQPNSQQSRRGFFAWFFYCQHGQDQVDKWKQQGLHRYITHMLWTSVGSIDFGLHRAQHFNCITPLCFRHRIHFCTCAGSCTISGITQKKLSLRLGLLPSLTASWKHSSSGQHGYAITVPYSCGQEQVWHRAILLVRSKPKVRQSWIAAEPRAILQDCRCIKWGMT